MKREKLNIELFVGTK